jgi:ferredoxin
MPIHEKSLIRPENLVTHEHLEIEGVDVSGHWSTFINSRAVTDYNEQMEEEIAALPGGEFIHRCWQCGSCTNSCTVNAINPDFNPLYHRNLVCLDSVHPDTARRLRLAAMVARHLALFVGGKLEVAGLGEFCCSSRPLRQHETNIQRGMA